MTQLTCSGFCTMYLLTVVCGYVVTFTVGEWSSCEKKIKAAYNHSSYIVILEPSTITGSNFQSENFKVICTNDDMWIYVSVNLSLKNIHESLCLCAQHCAGVYTHCYILYSFHGNSSHIPNYIWWVSKYLFHC